MLRIFLCLVSLFLFSPLSHSQNWTIELDKALRRLDRDGFFDGQILIAEAGEIRYAKSFGTTRQNEEIRGKTPLKVYSVGKSFTAVAILQLLERGKLLLSDPVTKYFPDLPYEEVTIDHLLHMTSISCQIIKS